MPGTNKAKKYKRCIHDRRQYYCKECNGKGICKHGIIKYHCKKCDGRGLCKMPWCEKHNSKKYTTFCSKCSAILDNILLSNEINYIDN